MELRIPEVLKHLAKSFTREKKYRPGDVLPQAEIAKRLKLLQYNPEDERVIELRFKANDTKMVEELVRLRRLASDGFLNHLTTLTSDAISRTIDAGGPIEKDTGSRLFYFTIGEKFNSIDVLPEGYGISAKSLSSALEGIEVRSI